jgi:hypothetical protein
MLKSFIYLGLYCFLTLSHGADSQENYTDLSMQSKNLWTITAILQNEQDEHFGFMFSLEHQGRVYHAVSGIFDLAQKKCLWSHEETMVVADEALPLDKMQTFYWHYNPINANLIIGSRDPNNPVGFHLKFDLLDSKTIHHGLNLTQYLKLKQYWPGNINGHINLPNESFVTSNNAWIQNVWQDNLDKEEHHYQHLLCKFEQGDALTALQVPEKKALRASYANLLNADGEKQMVSQFIDLKLSREPIQSIKIQQSQALLTLTELWANSAIYAYLAEMGPNKTQGFCLYHQSPWKDLKIPETTKPKQNKTFLNEIIALGQKPFKIAYNLKNKMTS